MKGANMIQRILVGYDESGPSKRAFAHALELAHRFGAELLVVSVVRIPESGLLAEVEGVIDTAEEHFKEAFLGMQQRAKEVDVTMASEVVAGHPAEQIVHLHPAARAPGAHRRTRDRRLGSGAAARPGPPRPARDLRGPLRRPFHHPHQPASGRALARSPR